MVSQAHTLKTKKETLWTVYLEDFLLSGRVEGKKAKTLEWYKAILTPFVNYLNQEGLSQLTLRKYANNLYDRLKITSVDTHIRAIRAFLNFLHQEGYLEENLTSTLKRPRLPKQFPYVLNDEQVNLLLKAPDKKTWEGRNNCERRKVVSQKFFPPPIDEMEKWWYIIIAIGSERLSRRMEKRASA